MKLNIICVGKLGQDYKDLFNNFEKKLNHFCDLNIIELKECKESNINIIKEKETAAILKAVPKNSKYFLLSLEGKEYTSLEFSKIFIEDNLSFIIGGSHGVIEKQFSNKIKVSKMTFPHQLFRVMLMEQIYRALSILNNTKYHK